DVHRHRDLMLPRNFRRPRHRQRVVSIDVQHAGADDLFGSDAGGIETQTFIAPPQHGALAGSPVNENVGGLIGAVLAYDHMLEIDTARAQAFHLDAAPLVIADRADVLDA